LEGVGEEACSAAAGREQPCEDVQVQSCLVVAGDFHGDDDGQTVRAAVGQKPVRQPVDLTGGRGDVDARAGAVLRCLLFRRELRPSGACDRFRPSGREVLPHCDTLQLYVHEDAFLVVLTQEPVPQRPTSHFSEERLGGTHELCQTLRRRAHVHRRSALGQHVRVTGGKAVLTGVIADGDVRVAQDPFEFLREAERGGEPDPAGLTVPEAQR
jgi:hypothetical protein